MKKFVILILYLTVFLIQLSNSYVTHLASAKFQLPSNHKFIRKKSVNAINRAMPSSKPLVRPIKPRDPCAPYDPPLPDFRAPGRRISETKCLEYIWQLKIRDDKEKRWDECKLLRSNVLSIVGGHSARRGEYPHMGALGWRTVVGPWKFLCGGTLISSNFLLTAAHCSKAPERDTTLACTEPEIVRLGNIDINNDLFQQKIIKVIVHPNYKSPQQYYDIALMELKKDLPFSKDIQPACLWTKSNIDEVQKAEVTGWGTTKQGSHNTSTELLAATVDLIDSTKCNILLRNWHSRRWNGIERHQICAGKLEGGVDTCEGDSGGPLSVKISLPIKSQGNMHYVIGVTAFGIGCALPGLPGVYTRVFSFIDWIEQNVWPEL